LNPSQGAIRVFQLPFTGDDGAIPCIVFRATRVSYKRICARGPAFTIQAGCGDIAPSRLRKACQSFAPYQSDLALPECFSPFPTAESVAISIKKVEWFSFLPPEGIAETFDADAQGMFSRKRPASGGCKRLHDSPHHGDHILRP